MELPVDEPHFEYPPEVQQFLPKKVSLSTFADCSKVLAAARRGLECVEKEREMQNIDRTVRGTNVKTQEILELKALRERIDAVDKEARRNDVQRHKKVQAYQEQLTDVKQQITRFLSRREEYQQEIKRHSSVNDELKDLDETLARLAELAEKAQDERNQIHDITRNIQDAEALL